MKSCRLCATPLTGVVLLAFCIALIWACSMLFEEMQQVSLYEEGQDGIPLSYHVHRDIPERESLSDFLNKVRKYRAFLREMGWDVYKIDFGWRDPALGRPYINRARIYYRSKGE